MRGAVPAAGPRTIPPRMLRRISTKWVVTVLAVVFIPFLGFAWYVDTQTAKRQWDVVRHYLLTMACDLASRLDRELHERTVDVELLAAAAMTIWSVDGIDESLPRLHITQTATFDKIVQKTGEYDLLLLVDAAGQAVVSNTTWPDGTRMNEEERTALSLRDFSTEGWFRAALAKPADAPIQTVLVDHHISDLIPRRVDVSVPHPENYHIGIAVPVRDFLDSQRVVGVLYALLRWSHIQNRVLNPERPRQPNGEDSGSDLAADSSYTIYTTSYPWVWMSDADTIIAHKTTSLYTQKVSGPEIDLPQLVAAARADVQGFYPEYTFKGDLKNAAFRHCKGPEQGGLGWIVGVGINNTDVTSFIEGLQSVLIQATLSVLAVVLVLTVVIARRTTAPILELQRHTQRVAAGDLEARVEIKSRDELGELGQAFNRMTHELAENRKRLIKAEKDAAWREMARQVAHEIKNPLTPIALSATLLKRAKDEHSPEYDSIFERTIELITRQVEHMRRIASDFSAFAGARKPAPEVLDAGRVLDDVLIEVAAWARAAQVEIVRRPGGGAVHVDKSELRRVFLNLISNSIEAMPQGGRLELGFGRVLQAGVARVEIVVRDTGVGLSDTVRARLFEPYFTTRTHGTGLGLAISARLVDEMGGTIELENLPPEAGTGTLARILLPEAAPGPASGPAPERSAGAAR